jgi:hypothetical protein
VNWVRSAKAGNDEDGYSEALLGIDEEGWFPLRIRASNYETEVIDGDSGQSPDTAQTSRDALSTHDTATTNGHTSMTHHHEGREKR